MSKQTTPEQYEKLAALMATKRDIAGGYYTKPKEEVQAFWEDVTVTLNSIGPPTKTATAWKKVWIDWKSYIKRKLSTNKKQMMSTGVGQCRLRRISPLEDKVIQLTGLVTSTSGICSSEDFGVASALQDDTEASEMDICARFEDPANVASTSKRRQQQCPKETTLSFFKDLVTSLEAINKDTKEFQESVVLYMRRLNRNVESLADTAKTQLAEEQRHNKIKEELLQQKFEIKMQMLRLQHPDHNFD